MSRSSIWARCSNNVDRLCGDSVFTGALLRDFLDMIMNSRLRRC